MLVVLSEFYFFRVLVAVPEEPPEPVSAAELLDDLVAGLGDELGRLDGEGRVPDHGQEGRVRLLGEGLSRQHRLQENEYREYCANILRLVVSYFEDGVALLDLVGHDVDDGGGSAAGAEEVELGHGVQGGLGHADGARVQFHDAGVGLVSSLPNPVVLKQKNNAFLSKNGSNKKKVFLPVCRMQPR